MGNSIAEIEDELRRICARSIDVGPTHAIRIRDDGDGQATLLGPPRGIDFHWGGSTAKILQRLGGLPDNGGPEAIRTEFA
jgi:hypothetical protein